MTIQAGILIHFILLITSSVYGLTCSAREQNVLICGVCRNVEYAVPNTIKNIEKLGSCFSNYNVIIYENNSTDQTVNLLSQWTKTNPRVNFVSETIKQKNYAKLREYYIAKARNIVLAIARHPYYDPFKYLIMVDLDFITPWPIEEIVKSIEQPFEWDCISANGIRNNNNGSYYDRYAFRDHSYPLGPELLGKPWWPSMNGSPIYFSSGNGFIPVYSAFGGLGIYKKDIITKYQYSADVNDALRYYYQRILGETDKSNNQLWEYANLIHHNNVSNLPVIFCEQKCCEHVTLHAAMANDGHDKFYINSNMVFTYNIP